MSKSDVLMWLSVFGDPWLSGPLAIVLVGLIAWRLRRPIKDHYARFVAWLGNRKNLRIAICVGLAPIGLIWFWLLVEAITEVWVLTSGVPQEGSGKDIADANRNRVQAIFFGVGLIGALLAAIIVPVRLWFQYRQTSTAEQGHITDRLTKAIEQLGAEKTQKFRVRSYEYDLPAGDRRDRIEKNQRAGEDPVIPPDAENEKFGEWQTSDETVPNLEVRLGAIYALERIAQDSERDHITVMETLCAYIRENAPASEARDHDLGEWPEYHEDATQEELEARMELLEERREGLFEWVSALSTPRVDLQAALTVIGRRSDERIEFERRQERSFALDLRGTNLRKADLTHANLDNALLILARMEGAVLSAARMEGADLSEAQMEGAYLREAQMERADLREARMEGADLSEARMEGANLTRARMERADLTRAQMERADLRNAQMEGADLTEARMEGADLSEARMERADLSEAQMERADLSEARMERADLSEAQMEGADLSEAQMEGADLSEARMEQAKFHSADLKSATLTETFADISVRVADLRSDSVTQEILNNVFGDAATKIPDGLDRPDHWDDQTFEWHEDDPKFEAWLESRREAKRTGGN